jgi:beta-phosphoglucomutase
MKFKAFLLDNDGVLCDTNKFHWAGYREVLAEFFPDLGEYTWAEHLTLLGVNTSDTFKSVLKTRGVPESRVDEMCERKRADYETRCANANAEILFNGIRTFLADSRAAGVKLIVCSSSTGAAFLLEKAGVRDLIHYIVNPADPTDCLTPASRKIGKIPGKPAPDLFEVGFLRAAEMLPGLTKDQVLGFEDATGGVAAIKRAGIRAVYFPAAGVSDAQKPATISPVEQKAFDGFGVYPDYIFGRPSDLTFERVDKIGY